VFPVTCSVDRDDTTVVFLLEYPPSVRAVALGTLQPLNLPFPFPDLVSEEVGLTSVWTIFPTFPFVVALNGIFLFFLFFELKSSRPALETVDLASSPSSSESDESQISRASVLCECVVLFDVGEYICVKICGGGKGRVEEFGVAMDDEWEGFEGTRRFGRGRMGREAIRDEGFCEEAGKDEYCWGVDIAVAEVMTSQPRWEKLTEDERGKKGGPGNDGEKDVWSKGRLVYY
jgi:hypothetical protein